MEKKGEGVGEKDKKRQEKTRKEDKKRGQDRMALPLILVSRGAHNERQHASVLENAAAVQKIAVGSASTLAREPSLA